MTLYESEVCYNRLLSDSSFCLQVEVVGIITKAKCLPSYQELHLRSVTVGSFFCFFSEENCNSNPQEQHIRKSIRSCVLESCALYLYQNWEPFSVRASSLSTSCCNKSKYDLTGISQGYLRDSHKEPLGCL